MAATRLRVGLCATVLAIILAVLWLFEDSRMTARAGQQQRRTAENGALLYEEHCRTCHGSRGEGVGQLGPTLADRHFFTDRRTEVGWLASLEEYIAATTTQGRMMATRPLYAGDGRTSVMPPWYINYGGPLRNDEISAVTTFVMGWEPTALEKVKLRELVLPPPDLSDKDTIRAGQSVFTEHCSSCHRLDPGDGQGAAPSLATIGLDAGSRVAGLSNIDYLRQSILVPATHIAGAVGEVGNEAQNCGGILSEDQLQAVVAFLLQQQGRPAKP